MRSNTKYLSMVGLFLLGGAVLALGCGSIPETAPEGEDVDSAIEGEPVAEAEQAICQASYDPAIADARALIAANCGAMSGCGDQDNYTHNDIFLQNSNYCGCYNYMWNNRTVYPWNSLQVIYHDSGACTWPHIHLKKMNTCNYFHFNFDEGYDAATGLPDDGDCYDDEPSNMVDKLFCNTGWLKSACSVGGCSTTALPQPSDKWRLRVFNNVGLDGEAVDVRYDAPGTNGFTFDWGAGSPSTCVPGDNFGVIFTRNAYFASSGTYTFTTTTDDGVKLLIDDVLIMNHWYDQAKTTRSVQHYVTAGWHVVKMKYYEKAGGAYAGLSWSLGSSPYSNCPCNRPDNYCQHAPSTPGCPMTYPGGYCDPNGDASYADGNWTHGYNEYQAYCN